MIGIFGWMFTFPTLAAPIWDRCIKLSFKFKFTLLSLLPIFVPHSLQNFVVPFVSFPQDRAYASRPGRGFTLNSPEGRVH